MSTSLTIADVAVRQDSAGRYCLNDLHRAAGGDPKHQPANWLRLDMTKDLAAELEAESIPQIRGIKSKQGVGTFVAKELVYAYAMWISASFHLKVIRAYDALVSGREDTRRKRHLSAMSNKAQAAILQEIRKRDGKDTAAHHYVNEALMVNQAVFGERAPVDRDALSSADLDLIAKVEIRNAVLIGMAMPYADRKSELSTYAAELRNTRQLALVAA